MISTNAGELASRLQEHLEQFEDEMEEERGRTLREARRLARRRVPVDTGDLRDDIQIDAEEGTLYNTLPYSIHVHDGTIYQDGIPYLESAAIDAFRESVRRLNRR